MDKKLQQLKEIVIKIGSALVAYAGGVDSTFLLKVAKDLLKDKVVAVTAVSLTYPSYEIESAKNMTKKLGVRHLIIETNEPSNIKFTAKI